jgi:hypothetical protein
VKGIISIFVLGLVLTSTGCHSGIVPVTGLNNASLNLVYRGGNTHLTTGKPSISSRDSDRDTCPRINMVIGFEIEKLLRISCMYILYFKNKDIVIFDYKFPTDRFSNKPSYESTILFVNGVLGDGHHLPVSDSSLVQKVIEFNRLELYLYNVRPEHEKHYIQMALKAEFSYE